MNYFRYKLLLCTSMAAAGLSSSDTTPLLRESITQQGNVVTKPNTSPRRHLIEGATCQVHRKEIVYGPTEEHPYGYSKESWACRLLLPSGDSASYASNGSFQYVDIVDTRRILEASVASSSVVPIVPGQTTLKLSEAIIENDTKMYIPDDAMVVVEPNTNLNKNDSKTRDLQEFLPTKGKIKALMIRVLDSNNIQPEASIGMLKNALYKKDSLKSQVEACSYNKLKIEPFKGTTETGKRIRGGVTNLQVNSYDISLGDQNEVDLESAIFEAANSEIGDLRSNDSLDLVMFCLPPEAIKNVMAYYIAGTKFIFYSNEWCSSTSAHMHLVGRSMGLQNSNSLSSDGDIIAYGDKTGVMGGSTTGGISRCYNAAKSHQLGWYNDRTQSIDPLAYRSSTTATSEEQLPEFVLNGVSDYGKNSDDSNNNNNNALVVLKLEQSRMLQDYYIGFNGASSIHADTPMDPNKIIILRTEGEHGGYGTSTKIAALNLGQYHILSDFNGKSRHDVAIRFAGLFEGNAIVQVIDIQNNPPELVLDALNSIHSQDIPSSDYRIEITTDIYPEDTYWAISENGGSGRVYATSPMYTEPETTVSTFVRLPHRDDDVPYKFVIFDEYGDGMQGNGSYKGFAFHPSEQLIFEGGSGDFDSGKKEHLFDAVLLENTVVIDTPIQRPCKNKRGKWIRFNGVMRTCKWIARKNKCDVVLKPSGDTVSKFCPRSCDRCNAS